MVSAFNRSGPSQVDLRISRELPRGHLDAVISAGTTHHHHHTKMKFFQLLASGIAFIALFCVSTSNANTITVSKTGNNGAGTLRQAIQDATTGDTIDFSITGTITLTSGVLLINKNLIISGPGARMLTVARSTASGTPDFGIFEIDSGAVFISGLTITNASGPNAALLNLSSGNVSVSDCTITGNNIGGFGGGAYSQAGHVTFENCTISNNTALQGAGVDNQATMNLLNCTVVGNTATTSASDSGGGGGIVNANLGAMTLFSCTISGNSATTNNNGSGGGGIYNASGTVHIGNTIVSANNTNKTGDDVKGSFTSHGYNLIRIGDGGSGFGNTGDQVGTASSPINAFLGPLQDNGGQTDTKAPSSGSPVIDQGNSLGLTTDQRGRPRPFDKPNKTNAVGGDGSDIGAYEDSPITLTVTNTNNSGAGSLRRALNDAFSGDTIDFAPNVTGSITLTSAQLVIDKSVTIEGPGARSLTVQRDSAAPAFTIFASLPPTGGSTKVKISGLTIANGNQPSQGGGITNFTDSTLTLSDCTLSANTAAEGGGIYNFSGATATITNCTFTSNSASNDASGGGGAYNNTNGVMTMTNCTVAGNQAVTGFGGGIVDLGTLTLNNCTVSANSARIGGGIASGGSAPAFHVGNSIVAGNSTGSGADPDCDSGFISDGYNLIGESDGSTGFTNGVNHDQVGTAAAPVNPKLGSLQSNGGPTDTFALLTGSTAINAGNDATAPARDQRGYVRNGVSDIGAFEFGGTIPVTLANISTRAFVQTGDNVLIGGFIITGTQQKKVLLRAIGPSLNLSGELPDPVLELHNSSGAMITSNDNWMDAPNRQEIIDSTVPPTNDLESAILMSLDPGAYTAIVRGVNDGTGIGLVEVYDLDRTVGSKLANISTRGFVQTGDNVMIGGFIILGPDNDTVIVRAIGPSLPVAGALADPTLELHDGNGALLQSNDNWVDSPDPDKQTIIDSTIPPTDDLESAIVATLPPGDYTAIVRGVNDTTGVALVEVYALN
jgi:hypothetical protein